MVTDTKCDRFLSMEAGDLSVSLDLMVRTLLAMGATREDVAPEITTFQHQG